jgi:hypothetical protein
VPRKDGTACTYGAHDDYSAAFTRFRDAVAGYRGDHFAARKP